jgi:hypothetical protein
MEWTEGLLSPLRHSREQLTRLIQRAAELMGAIPAAEAA